ncbi:MAG: thiamine pyrophosphate-dependent dehydrogenase E1 component subunit alpha [Deltaproteobacteria bacterium]|nr:thiamine pyrophosphate-dependent dehydrogenase E1 component subunit alpha [Deltaproteobacteria bacterium]
MIQEPHASLRDDDPDVGLLTVLRDDGSADPATDPKMPREVLLSAYRHMRRLRLLDARMIVLQRQGRVGFYGACTGQEAVPIGTGLVTAKDDWVFPALREQSVMLVRGFPLKTFIAQVFGNSGDVQKGRQMPSHQSGRDVHQVSWSSCIGPQIPQAVGAAHAMKLQKRSSVAFGFCGDGATSQPDFHAAMSFAGHFQVPVVIVCQNNHWSISVPTARQTASRTIAVKGRAYGVPSVRVDGNDLLAVYKVLGDAAARARSGGGPTFVEALTYRIGAHSTSDDPTRYRSDAEVEAWKKKDPVDRLSKHLRHLGAIDDAYEKALDEEVTAEIAAAVNEVEAMAPPARASLFEDVYGGNELPWHLREQRDLLMKLPPAPTHGG